MSRHFRIGWGTNSLLANSSGASAFGEVIAGGEPFSVVIEQQMMTGSGSHAQILSLESWLAVSLDNSEAVGEDVEGDASPIPKFEPVRGLKCLHAHIGEAATQMEEVMDDEEGASDNNREVGETKQVWDLMMALWGKLEGKRSLNLKCVRCFCQSLFPLSTYSFHLELCVSYEMILWQKKGHTCTKCDKSL